MATIPHATALNAQGRFRTGLTGGPQIEPVDISPFHITPFHIGDPSALVPMPSQKFDNIAAAWIP